jgi:hypothetical protein
VYTAGDNWDQWVSIAQLKPPRVPPPNIYSYSISIDYLEPGSANEAAEQRRYNIDSRAQRLHKIDPILLISG